MKELKDYQLPKHNIHIRVFVESGEGIESLDGRSSARQEISWNPVKELKDVAVSLESFGEHNIGGIR